MCDLFVERQNFAPAQLLIMIIFRARRRKRYEEKNWGEYLREDWGEFGIKTGDTGMGTGGNICMRTGVNICMKTGVIFV